VVRWLLIVETVVPDSQRKLRSVRLGEAASGKHVVRRSGGLSRDQGSDSLCGQ
jgi:hypothetical protein